MVQDQRDDERQRYRAFFGCLPRSYVLEPNAHLILEQAERHERVHGALVLEKHVHVSRPTEQLHREQQVRMRLSKLGRHEAARLLAKGRQIQPGQQLCRQHRTQLHHRVFWLGERFLEQAIVRAAHRGEFYSALLSASKTAGRHAPPVARDGCRPSSAKRLNSPWPRANSNLACAACASP